MLIFLDDDMDVPAWRDFCVTQYHSTAIIADAARITL